MEKRPTKILYEVCIASETNPGGITSHNSYDSEEDYDFVTDGGKEEEVEGEVSGGEDDEDGTCAIDLSRYRFCLAGICRVVRKPGRKLTRLVFILNNR